MALSIGIRNSISLLSAIQATRPLTITLVGLSPTEHTSFSWTRFRTAGFPRYGFKAGISDETFPNPPVCHRPACSLLHRESLLGVRGDVLVSTSVQAVFRSTPGALVPVRVMLSQSIFTYSA